MKKRKIDHKDKKLYESIIRLIRSLMIFVFVVLILFSSIMTQTSLTKATFNDLNSISKANGCQVQEYMNICQSTAKGLVAQIEKSFLKEEKELKLLKSKETSEVYKQLKLNILKKELENYMIGTAKNAVENSKAVIGIGIMFEPFQFTKDRESYALYFTEDNGEITVTDVGAYEEFSKNNYYQIAVGKKDTVFTEPYTYRDMWMLTGATPILVDGKQIGVINVDISMDAFGELSLQNDTYSSLNVQIISSLGTIDFDSVQPDNISKNISDVVFKDGDDGNNVTKQMEKGEAFRYKYKNKDGKGVYSFYYPLKAGSEVWQTVTTVQTQEIFKSSFITIVLLCLIATVSLVIIISVTKKTLRERLRPIDDIVEAANSIASGNLDISLQINTEDEIGVLANTFMQTCKSLKGMISDISCVLGEIEKNNYMVTTNVEYKGDFEQIEQSIKAIIENMVKAINKISLTSDQVAIGAKQMSETSLSLASDATEQANAIEKLTKSIHEVSEEVEVNAMKATQACELVQTVGGEVEVSNGKMEDMVKAMTEITEASKHIEMIIQNIESIAAQTNLLSLNASIEAARAGEAGKGFAVVANEIGSLANQSAEAAKDTKKLIEESIFAVENGTKIADATEESMEKLVTKIKETVETIEIIAASSEEQRESIEQIEQNVTQISDVVQNNSGSAEESSATSEELEAQADLLKNLVEEFKIK